MYAPGLDCIAAGKTSCTAGEWQTCFADAVRGTIATAEQATAEWDEGAEAAAAETTPSARLVKDGRPKALMGAFSVGRSAADRALFER